MSTVKAASLQNTGSGAPAFKNSSGTEIGQLVKAWVNWNGQGTVSIRDDFNVSSIGDLGTGIFSVNFATSLANANYALVGNTGNTANNTSGTNAHMSLLGGGKGTATISSSRCDVLTGYQDNTAVDYPQNMAIIIGA